MEEILIVTGDIIDYKDKAVLVISPETGCFALKGDVFTDLRNIPGYYVAMLTAVKILITGVFKFKQKEVALFEDAESETPF